jgi:hypothetical protein
VPELVPELVPVMVLELVLALELELVQGLVPVPELVLAPEPEPVQGLVPHKQPPNHPSGPLPSPKLKSIFYSLSPPSKIIEPKL